MAPIIVLVLKNASSGLGRPRVPSRSFRPALPQSWPSASRRPGAAAPTIVALPPLSGWPCVITPSEPPGDICKLCHGSCVVKEAKADAYRRSIPITDVGCRKATCRRELVLNDRLLVRALQTLLDALAPTAVWPGASGWALMILNRTTPLSVRRHVSCERQAEVWPTGPPRTPNDPRRTCWPCRLKWIRLLRLARSRHCLDAVKLTEYARRHRRNVQPRGHVGGPRSLKSIVYRRPPCSGVLSIRRQSKSARASSSTATTTWRPTCRNDERTSTSCSALKSSMC